jgi:hypothetical protein
MHALLRTTALLAATGLSLTVVGAAHAAPKKQTLEGKLTWTIVTTTADLGDPANPSNFTQDETTTQEHSLQIQAVRDPRYTRTYVFKPVKAPYSYTYTSTRVSKDFTFSQLSCQTTTTTNASGTGTTAVNPSVFGKYNGRRDVLVLDKRTKGISVGAVLPGAGTSTTVITGFGTSPCQEGSYTDPIDETGSTSLNDSRNICLPSGLKNPGSSYRPLLGTFNVKKKRFDFACSQTFNDGVTMQSIRVAGSLKYAR